MIDIIKIVPSPVTPDRILNLKINYNGEVYSGFVIKEDNNESTNIKPSS